MKVEIYFDGSCLINPNGPMGYGYHANMGGIEIHDRFSGQAAAQGNSNNVAEYKALMMALEDLQETKEQSIVIRGDSQLVIRQMNGHWGIKNGAYTKTAHKCKELLGKILKNGNRVKFEWIRREFNGRADELSNMYYSASR